MNARLGAILRSRFARSAVTLGGGTALGQALVFAATPLWTRLYGPDAMAMLGLFLAFVGMATVALSLRYDLAIVVARSEADAGTLLVLNLAMLPFTSGVAAAAFALVCHLGAGGYRAFPGWAAFALWILLAMTGAFTSLRFWCVRQGEFGAISRGLVQQGAARAVAPLLAALATSTWVGLLAGEFAGRILGVRRLFVRASGAIRSAAAGIDGKVARRCLRTYRQFPLLHLPSSLVDAVGGGLPMPLFASAYGASSGGQFFLAYRVVLAPATLVSAAVADVYHHRIVEAARGGGGNCRREVLTGGAYLLLAGLAIYLPVAVVAPFAAPWVFGAGWTQTGWAITGLVPAAISGTVTNPLSRAISLSSVPQAKWVADVVRFGLPLAAILACSSLGTSFVAAVAWFAAATAVGDLAYFLVILYSVAPHRLRALTDAEGA